MRKHIGMENAISSAQLFKKVYQVNPEDVEFYKRYFLWKIILKIMRSMRKENEVYIVNKSDHIFVLKSQDECKQYNNFLEKNIKGLRSSQRRAKAWVDNESWRNF